MPAFSRRRSGGDPNSSNNINNSSSSSFTTGPNGDNGNNNNNASKNHHSHSHSQRKTRVTKSRSVPTPFPVTPLPKPSFREEPLSFSTKKAGSSATPKSRLPPRSPAKSCPPVSRVFRKRPEYLLPHRPRSVTFLESPNGSLTGSPVPTGVYDSSNAASYFEQAFAIEGQIGEGYFGKVIKVRSRKDGKLYAVKIAKDRYKGSSDRARKLEEVRKHQVLLPHPNCVHFFQSWEDGGRLYQQFELCQGTLLELAEAKHDLPESLIWAYLVDLLLATQHLHDHNLIHMDIKPENIFIGLDGVCKLGDFGLVIDLAREEKSGLAASSVAGDSKYMAAEILEHKFTKAADVFSLGVTILELACDLDLPNGGRLWHRLRESGPDPQITARLSPDLCRIIQLMMGKDHNRRPTVGQLLQLPAVKSARASRTRQLYFTSLVIISF